MALVIDASVALKWLFDEAGADRARALVGDEALFAPEFLMIECANVLAIKARTGPLTPAQARASLAALRAATVRLVPDAAHLEAAHAIAMELSQSVYDSLYLAVAAAEEATLVTADERFARAALATPAYSAQIKPL